MSERLASPLVHVDVGLLADDVGEPTANTLDGGHGEHDLLLPIDVGVQQTQDVLEVLTGNERLRAKKTCLVNEKRKQYAVKQRIGGDRILPWRRRIGCSRRKAATAKGGKSWASARLRFLMMGWGKDFIWEGETLELHRTAAICLRRDGRISALFESGDILGLRCPQDLSMLVEHYIGLFRPIEKI
jgi:hypothetical protein